MNCFSGGQFCREAGLFFLCRNVAGGCHEKQCCVFGGTLAIFASSSDFGTKRHKHIFIMEAEKIICCDGARNNDALAWAAMANKGNDPMAMAAMMNGGMGGQWNNPFVYLVWMMFANRFFGENGLNGQNAQNVEMQNQLQAIRSQMQDNQNTNALMDAIKGNGCNIQQLAGQLNCDFNTLNSAICDVRQGISTLSGQVGYSAERVINAVNLGDMNLIQQLKDCCCQTQQNIIKMGYDNQLGQKDIVNGMQQGFSYTNTGMERGFSNVGFQMSQLACDLKTNANDNTQRIIDTLNGHWQEDLQLRLNRAELELSQQRQNATLIAALGTKTPTATT